MAPFARFFILIAVSLGLLSTFGGIVAITWLAVLDEWQIIGVGLLALFLSRFVLTVTTMPGSIFVAPAVVLLRGGNRIAGHALGLLGTAYTVGIITLWCIGILHFFTSLSAATPSVPVLLWSYGIATWPVTLLGQRELHANSDHGVINLFSVRIAYVLVVVAFVLTDLQVVDLGLLFATVVAIGVMVQFRWSQLAGKAHSHLTGPP